MAADKTTKRNRELLERVAQRIEAFPEHYDQGLWMTDSEDRHLDEGDDASCGTHACIAGWAVIEAGEKIPAKWEDVGAELLGLTHNEAKVLFDQDWKPRGHDEADTAEMEGKRVGEALRRLAEGDSVRNITDPTSVSDMALARSDFGDRSGVSNAT